jgi:hypothetical protein
MTMSPDYDQGGNPPVQYTRVALGPSLGKVLVPILPQTKVTSGTSYTIQPYDSVILLKTPISNVYLPSVAQWMTAQGPNGLVMNKAPWQRSIWIKDLTGVISIGSPVTVNPSGSDLIDQLSSYELATPFELIRLYALSDLSGWMVG